MSLSPRLPSYCLTCIDSPLGIGKTTLLRALAKRELRLPPQLSLLHVEQEVVGDDTLAVESVLESDQERTRLLKREAELVGGGGREENSEG